MAEQVFTRQTAGSWAHRITPEKLKEYRELSEAVEDPEVKYHMLALCKMVEVFFETPDVSGGPLGPFGEPRTPLPKDEVERIWDHVPWPAEIDMIRGVCNRLTDKPTLRAAGYLIWYARELAKDRQPITKDLLPPHLQ